MSFAGVVDATARVIAGVSGMEAVYASTATSTNGINPVPLDLPITPAAIVRHGGFSLTPGSFERIHHLIECNLYFENADPGVAEKTMYTIVDGVVAAMRANTDILHQADIMKAVVLGGDAPVSEDFNGKPVQRLTVNIDVLEAGVRTYSYSP